MTKLTASPFIRLIVGLGNPGDKYAGTRHNAGFHFIETLKQQPNTSSETKKYDALLSHITVNDHKIMLLMPQTFMNLSGKSVLQAASFYKIRPEEILVAHDEIDLVPGKPRIKKAGGDGGHNGLKDITKMLGPNYYRLRLGVGRPGDPRFDTAAYVLGKFTNGEHQELNIMCDFFTKHITRLIAPSEHTKLLSAYADLRRRPPKPKPPVLPASPSPE